MSHKKNSKRKQAIKTVLASLKSGKQGLEQALDILKQMPKTKFDEGIELVVHLGIDTAKADQQIRGSAILPAGTGRKIRLAVVAQGQAAQEARDAGADLVGSTDLVKDIEAGKLDFDKLVATLEMMKELGKLGRILGPKGLMPNPKDGTVTNEITRTVVDIKKGKQVNFRAEKAGGVVHIIVGRRSFSDEELIQNIQEALQTLNRMKPSTTKGSYFKSAFLKTTMGGAVEIDINKALVTARPLAAA